MACDSYSAATAGESADESIGDSKDGTFDVVEHRYLYCINLKTFDQPGQTFVQILSNQVRNFRQRLE